MVASRPLDFAGGVEQQCRRLLEGLRHLGFEAIYVPAGSLVPAWCSRLATATRLQGMAEALATRGGNCLADVVVTNGPIGWGVRGRRLSVHWYHGTYAGQAEAIRPFIRRRGYVKMRYVDSMILERLAGAGKVCVANSERTAKEVEQQFGYNCQAVWFSVDLKHFRPGPREPHILWTMGLDLDRPVVLFVGAGRPMKGEIAVLEAAAEVRNATWIILGERLFRANKTPSNVLLHPPVPPDFMPHLLRAVDVLVMPSLYEPAGTVAAEALACGTPVIAAPSGTADLMTRDPALAEWVLPDPRNSSMLARLVRKALEGGAQVRALFAERGPAIVQPLNIRDWTRNFLETIGMSCE